MSKIIILGAHGLLGQNLVKQFAKTLDVHGIGIEPAEQFAIDTLMQYSRCDITDASQLSDIGMDSDCVAAINAAAYTNVDGAESDSERAYLLNRDAVQNILEVIPDDVPLVHISTDYIFDGSAGPYRETDPVAPQGVYAQSKWDGEKLLLDSGQPAIIVRPNVLYGNGEKLTSSFVAWLVGELRQGHSVNIVDDQFNNPTYAKRLAEVVDLLIGEHALGAWHFGSREVVSRYTFALKIADVFELDAGLINPISTAELGQKALRPMKSGLICDKLVEKLKYPILPLRTELELLREEMYAG
ncbi:MAG: SDR family oxidoreductase [Candidatus Marinimicrobia bacterium]|nr:SDR family oxidoreductase [Candidatus Neomarinimicrobiota bacterium]MCF7839577.1 SDR family oxidoreductase [Candidatus Neomarinimicrobiota bacterium]